MIIWKLCVIMYDSTECSSVQIKMKMKGKVIDASISTSTIDLLPNDLGYRSKLVVKPIECNRLNEKEKLVGFGWCLTKECVEKFHLYVSMKRISIFGVFINARGQMWPDFGFHLFLFATVLAVTRCPAYRSLESRLWMSSLNDLVTSQQSWRKVFQ